MSDSSCSGHDEPFMSKSIMLIDFLHILCAHLPSSAFPFLAMPKTTLWRQTSADCSQIVWPHQRSTALSTIRATYFRLCTMLHLAKQLFVHPYSDLGELAFFCESLLEHHRNTPTLNCTFVSRPQACLLEAQPYNMMARPLDSAVGTIWSSFSHRKTKGPHFHCLLIPGNLILLSKNLKNILNSEYET